MKNAMTVFYRSLYDMYQNLGTVIWSTILWWICVLPIFTLGPASAGLFYVLKQKRLGKSVGPRDFFYGMRSHFGVGIRISFLYLLISVPGFIYFFLLLRLESFATYFLAIILLYFLVMWHFLLLYMFPLLVEQESKKLSILFKRSLRLVSENYVFTINIVLYLVLLTLISSIISILIVVWAGWMVITASNSLLFLLNKYDPENYPFDPTVSWKGIWKAWK
ncbi:DUF624 domain-containing protein [Halalkalibacter kiskunsagensis]|uniref:DUF624 domain-containing protein n=1 Tax=Halalkalibacter kiskunsagensis TaxID=1548599 RepID=A0ABV6KIY1_9BACI